MNYDCMVAEHVNRVGMVTTPLCYVRLNWRWELRDENWHANSLAWYMNGYRCPKRMENRLCSHDCNYCIHASFGIIPCMYDKKTDQNFCVVDWLVITMCALCCVYRHKLSQWRLSQWYEPHAMFSITQLTCIHFSATLSFCTVQALCHWNNSIHHTTSSLILISSPPWCVYVYNK